METLRQLAKVVTVRSGADDNVSLGLLMQRLCVTIRSVKARAVLRRAGCPRDPRASDLESACDALDAAVA